MGVGWGRTDLRENEGPFCNHVCGCVYARSLGGVCDIILPRTSQILPPKSSCIACSLVQAYAWIQQLGISAPNDPQLISMVCYCVRLFYDAWINLIGESRDKKFLSGLC